MKNTRIKPLTWLRGIAALLVIISHSMRATAVSYTLADRPAWTPFDIRLLGEFGVTLFFVLSGFTLFISNSELHSKRDLLGFYLKRFLRIWPAFAFSLFLYLGLNKLFSHHYGELRGFWIEPQWRDYSFKNVLQYLSLTFDIRGPYDLFNRSYWSLPVEFQFYLLFPLALFLLNRFGFLALISFGGLLYAIGATESIPIVDQRVFTLAYSFFGGMLLGWRYSSSKSKLSGILSAPILIILFLIILVIQNNYAPLPRIPGLDDRWNYFAMIAILTVFVVSRSDFPYFPKRLQDLMHTYGEISYSTYLFHQIFISSSVLLILKLNMVGEYKLFFTFFVTLVGTYFFSCATYKYIEDPFIRLSHRLVKRFNPKTTSTRPAYLFNQIENR